MGIVIEKNFTTTKEFYNVLKDNNEIFNEIKKYVWNFNEVGINATLEVHVNKETKIGFDLVVTGVTLGDVDSLPLGEFDSLAIEELEGSSQGDISEYNDFIKNRSYYIKRPRHIKDMYIRDSGIDVSIKITLY